MVFSQLRNLNIHYFFRILGAIAAMILIYYFFFSCFKNSFIDDAFITMQYAKVLKETHTWGFFPDQITNTATSPLNVICITLVSLLTLDQLNAVVWLTVIEAIILTFSLFFLAHKWFNNNLFAILALTTIIFNPFLISTLGMESFLYITLFVLSLLCFAYRKWNFLSLTLSLITLTRPDGCLLFLIYLVALLINNYKNGGVKELFSWKVISFISIYLAALMPWLLFSWIYLGSFIPETFFIKTAQKQWGNYSFHNGLLLYFNKFPVYLIFSLIFTPVFLALPFFFKRTMFPKKTTVMLVGFIIIYFLGYSSLKVPPYHWYYIPFIIPLQIISIIFVSSLCQNLSTIRTQKICIIILSLLPICGMILYFVTNKGLVIKEVPIHTNWAQHEVYKVIGRWLKNNIDETDNIRLIAEVGTLAYYSDRKLVDFFSDRSDITKVMNKYYDRGGIYKIFAKTNFFWLKKDIETIKCRYELTSHKDNLEEKEFVNKWILDSRWVKGKEILLFKYKCSASE